MNPFEGYRITSPYGPRIHPVIKLQHFHTGIDLVKYHRAPIPAFVGGQVVHAGGGKPGTGFGNMGVVVAIKDKNGCLHCYVHLDSVSVAVGDVVMQGQEIGRQGNTGKYSTASHLHYEVRKRAAPSFGWVEAEVARCYDPTQYLIDYYAKEAPDKPAGEGEDELKLTASQRTMLVKALRQLAERGTIEAQWADKAERDELTLTELCWLNLIVLARKEGQQ